MRLNLLTLRISDDTFNKNLFLLDLFFMILENYFFPFI